MNHGQLALKYNITVQPHDRHALHCMACSIASDRSRLTLSPDNKLISSNYYITIPNLQVYIKGSLTWLRQWNQKTIKHYNTLDTPVVNQHHICFGRHLPLTNNKLIVSKYKSATKKCIGCILPNLSNLMIEMDNQFQMIIWCESHAIWLGKNCYLPEQTSEWSRVIMCSARHTLSDLEYKSARLWYWWLVQLDKGWSQPI